jgi:hypothetical protein
MRALWAGRASLRRSFFSITASPGGARGERSRDFLRKGGIVIPRRPRRVPTSRASEGPGRSARAGSSRARSWCRGCRALPALRLHQLSRPERPRGSAQSALRGQDDPAPFGTGVPPGVQHRREDPRDDPLGQRDRQTANHEHAPLGRNHPRRRSRCARRLPQDTEVDSTCASAESPGNPTAPRRSSPTLGQSWGGVGPPRRVGSGRRPSIHGCAQEPRWRVARAPGTNSEILGSDGLEQAFKGLQRHARYPEAL